MHQQIKRMQLCSWLTYEEVMGFMVESLLVAVAHLPHHFLVVPDVTNLSIIVLID